MTKKYSDSYFVPHVPNPLDAHYIFPKDESVDELINGILGNSVSRESICEKWYDYFQIHLTFPFSASVQCPLKIQMANSMTTCFTRLTIMELAPLNRCNSDNMVLFARQDPKDYGRYVFVQDISRVENNELVE